MEKQIEALKMAIDWIEADWKPTNKEAVLKTCKEALAEAEKQEPVAWMEEYQSCKVNGDERLCHSDKVFRLVQLLASQLSECQSLCAKYAEETVKNGEQKLKEVTAIKEALEKAEKQEPIAWTTEFDMTNIWESPESPGEPFIVPLYTHPATWQSLSDDEIDNIWSMNFEFGFRACARAIEQTLKEKNHV